MKKQILLRDQATGTHYSIHLPCVLGRTKKADLSFSDPTVSHRHARVYAEEERVWIEDLQSVNGVFVNGKKIAARNPLTPGDSIQIGQTSLFYIEGENAVDTTVVLQSREHREESLLDQQRLQLIYKIATQLSESQDLAALRGNLTSRFKEIFQHDRACLALFQEDGSLQPVLSEAPLESIPLSRNIIDRVFQRGESLLLGDALSDASLKDQESILALNIRSALCAPLVYHGQIYGLIYLDRNVPGAYNEGDLDLLRTIALIVAPLIENARLWSELKGHYDQVLVRLKETQARLIEMEREAAYVRLAQAMAHEIRNPLMGIGGMVKRMLQTDADVLDKVKLQSVLGLVERVESVMKEVDSFVKLPPPERTLIRIDQLIQKCMEERTEEWARNGIRPILTALTSHLLVPLDAEQFRHAISMIFKETIPSISRGADFELSISDAGRDVEVRFGEVDPGKCSCEVHDRELQRRPWSLGLFLNIAHKIISDHGGKMLFDPEGHSPYPMVIRLPRTIKM